MKESKPDGRSMPHHIPELQTPRLLLRPVQLSDASQLQAAFPQWDVVRYLNKKVPWPYPANGAETFLRTLALPAMERGEEWIWSIRRKAAPETLIGAIRLAKSENENRGFWIVPEWRGQGLVSEACDAVTEYWFGVLKFPVLRAPKAIANEASRRISVRQGMRMVSTGEGEYVSGRLPSEVWEITAEEWRARRREV
jgi:[ribosomal protein S5]-alanine N-acetyltransferase